MQRLLLLVLVSFIFCFASIEHQDVGSRLGNVPVIDLHVPEHQIIPLIREACETFGFFQVVNHSIDEDLIQRFRTACSQFFEGCDQSEKDSLRRSISNARGYFDDELTKQRRDWKEAIDIGVPYSRDWDLPDQDPRNYGLDGCNRFPVSVGSFRATCVEYFQACERVADRLAQLMAKGLGASINDPVVQSLRDHHTSYLRTNFYPPKENDGDGTLGISPHNDAGFLTILLQDDTCHSLQVDVGTNGNPLWETVSPVPGALTINTGDMAQVWSNGRFRAPSHRVLTSSKKRYSMPFFYNPGYESWIRPVTKPSVPASYHPLLWGYFRAVRFAGDFTDLGVEIQVADYENCQKLSAHLQRQELFQKNRGCELPFSVDAYRSLLEKFPDR